jgi:hypothetical protein
LPDERSVAEQRHVVLARALRVGDGDAMRGAMPARRTCDRET